MVSCVIMRNPETRSPPNAIPPRANAAQVTSRFLKIFITNESSNMIEETDQLLQIGTYESIGMNSAGPTNRKATNIRIVARTEISLGSETRFMMTFQTGADRMYIPWIRMKTPPTAGALSVNWTINHEKAQSITIRFALNQMCATFERIQDFSKPGG